MNYSNKHLAEIICGFQFNQETTSWDKTFFGQYFEKIKTFGFNETQERKGYALRIEGVSNIAPIIKQGEVDDEVIFKNNERGWAIILGKQRISFHIVRDYKKWDAFRDELIKPFYNKYLELGLGNGPRQCNVMYLNRFVKLSSKSLDTYFTIINNLSASFGEETSTLVQRLFNNNGKNLLVARLNSDSIMPDGNKYVTLECGAICISEICQNADWILQANETREPIRGFFEAIITEELRKQL